MTTLFQRAEQEILSAGKLLALPAGVALFFYADALRLAYRGDIGDKELKFIGKFLLNALDTCTLFYVIAVTAKKFTARVLHHFSRTNS